jgi:hypothetical protein
MDKPNQEQQTKYVIRLRDGRESEPFDFMTTATAVAIAAGLPFSEWTVEPCRQ